MITRSSLVHINKSQMAYAYNHETLHLRLRTAKNEVKKVELWIGDPYRWEGGALGGNLESANHSSTWIGGEAVSMKLEGQTEYFDCWFADYTPSHKRARYGFIIHSTDGTEKLFFGEKQIENITHSTNERKALNNLSNLFCFPFLNPIDVLSVPNWVSKTVWYQIFPERFAIGDPTISPKNTQAWGTTPTQDNFMGGDLWGIIDKLDYLVELGITGIYLCPIFTAKANHKYDTIDYFNVDPHFGGNKALKALVETAHQKGIKIMLDAVFNHSGALFSQWLDVVKKGERSKYKDWFWINRFPVYPDKINEVSNDWDLPYATFSNVPSMPKLNTENHQCRQFLLDVATFWIKEFDIDGWRLDVANEVDHVFWREFRQQVKHIKPECYILGEVWHEGNAWLKGEQFDALMNYPLTNAINSFIANRSITSKQFMYQIDQARLNYPQQATDVMFNLLDSHDTDRILSECDGDIRRVELAYLLLFLQPGAPCIYYGGEIGLDGIKIGQIEGARKCMIWDERKQNLDLKAFIQTLIRIRKSIDAFSSQNIAWIDISESFKVSFNQGRLASHVELAINHCVGFVKDSILVLINNNGFPVKISFPVKLGDANYQKLWARRILDAEENTVVYGQNDIIHFDEFGFIILELMH